MAKAIACGSCAQCTKTLVYLAWRDGKRKIIVACDDCQTDMVFDLENLIEYLGSDNPIDMLLESFVPKGKPS